MKSISPTLYAKAFWRALEGKPKGAARLIIQRFLEEIRKRGDWPRRMQILNACEKTWRTRNHRPLLVIESARPIPPTQRAKVLKYGKAYAEDVEEKINPALVAGVRFTVDDAYQLDGSLAHLLRTLFSKNVIPNL